MTHLEGNIWFGVGKKGKKTYYYRRLKQIFENGKKKYQDVRRSLGGSLEFAQKEARRLDAELDNLPEGELVKKNPRLGEFATQYVSHIRDHRGLLGWDTVQSNLNVLRRHFGDSTLVGSITKADLESFLSQRKLMVSPTTVNTYLRDIKRLFGFAVELGYLEVSQAARIKAFRAPLRPIRLPTQEEVGKILSYVKRDKPWLYRLLLFLVSTGCRLSEALTMTWNEVDFTNGSLVLARRKVQDFHPVPMGAVLKSCLWELWAEEGMPKAGHVFTGRAGKSFTPTGVLTVFKPVVAKLGLPWLTLKCFRKLAATHAAEATGDLRTAQLLLGHKSVRTTELYLGRGDEAKARAVDAVDRFLDGAVGMVVGILPKTTLSS